MKDFTVRLQPYLADWTITLGEGNNLLSCDLEYLPSFISSLRLTHCERDGVDYLFLYLSSGIPSRYPQPRTASE
jgi:hypothetical protein